MIKATVKSQFKKDLHIGGGVGNCDKKNADFIGCSSVCDILYFFVEEKLAKCKSSHMNMKQNKKKNDSQQFLWDSKQLDLVKNLLALLFSTEVLLHFFQSIKAILETSHEGRILWSGKGRCHHWSWNEKGTLRFVVYFFLRIYGFA